MSDDVNDLPVLEIAAKVVEHNDHLVSIDALLNGDERVMGKLARALLAATAEVERMRAELAAERANAVRMREYRFALEGIETDGNGNPIDRARSAAED